MKFSSLYFLQEMKEKSVELGLMQNNAWVHTLNSTIKWIVVNGVELFEYLVGQDRIENSASWWLLCKRNIIFGQKL